MSVAEPETLLAAPSLPALRLLPAPSSEPPYDDELPGGTGLRLVPGAGLPALRREPAPAPLRLLPPPAADPGADPAVDPDGDGDGGRTPLGQLPPPRPFAQALVQRLLEVQAGLRPVGQLQRDTSLELFDRLCAAISPRRRADGPRPTRRDVRSVHVQARADGVAEVCATVHRAGRVTALALRLEGRSGAWRCTELVGL